MITYNRIETQKHPFPDLCIQRKWANHGAFLVRQREHEVSTMKSWHDTSPPDGVFVDKGSTDSLEWEWEVDG